MEFIKKTMIFVKNSEGNYLTRKSLTTNFSFTNNKNFAYIFDSEAQAQSVIQYLDVEANIEKE